MLYFKNDNSSLEHVHKAGGWTGACSGKAITGGQEEEAGALSIERMGRRGNVGSLEFRFMLCGSKRPAEDFEF